MVALFTTEIQDFLPAHLYSGNYSATGILTLTLTFDEKVAGNIGQQNVAIELPYYPVFRCMHLYTYLKLRCMHLSESKFATFWR